MRGHPDTPEARFWAKVEFTDTCWLWTAYKLPEMAGNGGYGLFGLHAKTTRYSHRWAYEYMVGPIPDGYHIDHLCRVRHCVNPAHLEAVPPRVNYLRGTGFSARNAAKEKCVRGHALDGANVRITPDGKRDCLACCAQRQRDMRRKRKELAS